MSYFNWTSANEMGHPEIDDQHKQLFLLGEAVLESLQHLDQKNVAVAKINAFIASAREHFTYEEGLMRSAGYPGLDQHAKFHASLLADLRVHCDKVQWDPKTNPADLTKYLSDWLTLHIDLEERDLVAWLKSH
jgi:hemerythrin-like metal-binding protein